MPIETPSMKGPAERNRTASIKKFRAFVAKYGREVVLRRKSATTPWSWWICRDGEQTMEKVPTAAVRAWEAHYGWITLTKLTTVGCWRLEVTDAGAEVLQ
jgi:hypothetical protein